MHVCRAIHRIPYSQKKTLDSETVLQIYSILTMSEDIYEMLYTALLSGLRVHRTGDDYWIQ
jgi:hypothetical protein